MSNIPAGLTKGSVVRAPADQVWDLKCTFRGGQADELTLFAETALKGKKAVFFAAEQSIFAKHITTYLTSWNMDVSHMPYEPGDQATEGVPLAKPGLAMPSSTLDSKDSKHHNPDEPALRGTCTLFFGASNCSQA